MKLHREPTKEKPNFFMWILFHPLAFKVLFYMSIISGLLVSTSVMILSWVFNWGIELSVIFTGFWGLNVYTSVKWLRTVTFADSTVNDFVYSGKFKPKKTEVKNNSKHDNKWPKIK